LTNRLPAQQAGRIQPRAEAEGRCPGFTGATSRRLERPGESSVPHVALVKFDISLEERTELLLKRLDSMMLALVADVGSNVFDLRLGSRKPPETPPPQAQPQ